MAQTRSDVFEHLLLRRVNEVIAAKTEQLKNGTGIDSYEKYREIVGAISALNDIEELCRDVQLELDKR